jgi:hypothetical protein
MTLFVAGNAWDWVGGHSWGPAQSTQSSLVVHASAALFWLALSMLALCVRDLISFLIHHSPSPPPNEAVEAGSSWWSRGLQWWNAHFTLPVHEWASRNQALIGVGCVAAGALFGHFVWQP